LQALTLLGNINISAPEPIHWVFSAASFAFSTVTSGSLSTDCLLSGHTNPAVQRVLLHLAVPPIVLLVLVFVQTLWYPFSLDVVCSNAQSVHIGSMVLFPDSVCIQQIKTVA